MSKDTVDIDKLIKENELEINRIMKDHSDGPARPKGYYEENRDINRVIKLIESRAFLFPMLDNNEEIIPKLINLKNKKRNIDPWLFDLTVLFATKAHVKPRSYHSPHGNDHPFYLFIKQVFRMYKQTPPSQSALRSFLKKLTA